MKTLEPLEPDEPGIVLDFGRPVDELVDAYLAAAPLPRTPSRSESPPGAPSRPRPSSETPSRPAPSADPGSGPRIPEKPGA
ncbi:hypothetical protein ACFQX6_36095 [Streptosporangium lutulentum]